MDLTGNTAIGAAIAAGAMITIQLIQSWAVRRLKHTDVVTGVETAEIADRAALTTELMEQVERLWSKNREMEGRIGELHNEVMACEERYSALKRRYENVVREIKRLSPDWDDEAE